MASHDESEKESDEPAPATFVARPDGDLIALAVAKARVANQLFARQDRVTLGRYHLLETIGAGGMGTVWGAFDPELDRRVAIKLVKATLASARDRILAEGQALAKLAHPNVVTVFDVGIVDEQVYIVMEWIRGKTLREFMREPRSIREVVAVYRAAGEGLAAAHEAGLVHRDFKPDNAILGDDTRVRVLDFGLARGELRAQDVDTLRGAGTPRYMPPEQLGGRELTPAVDQYAFCISLREALVGRTGTDRPAEVPAWLGQILERGTAPDAKARYPSMTALLAALARDPAAIWRRRLALAGVAVVATGAFAIGTIRAGQEPVVERCTGGREEIAKIWSPTTRAAMTAHLGTLGPYGGAEATRLATVLDDSSRRWETAHRGACLARDRGELTPQLYERNLACLARSRAALATAVEVLSTVTRERVPDAVAAAGELSDATGCLSEAEASTIAPPPAEIAARASELGAEIERARVLARAIAPDAIAFAEATTTKAVKLGYLPAVARSHLELGRARFLQHQGAAAIEALQRASTAGFEASDPATAVEAYALEIRQIAGTANPDERPANATERLAAMPIMEAIAKGLGPTGAIARALFYNNIGNVRLIAGDRAGARAAFLQARDALAAMPDHADLAAIEQNLALVTEDVAAREQVSANAIARLSRVLGPDHPSVLDLRVTGAMFLQHPERALVALREPCRRFATIHPHLPARSTTCWFEIGWLAEERGDPVEARAAMAAVTAPGPKRTIAEGYLAMLDGKHVEAADKMLALANELLANQHPAVGLRGVTALTVAAISQLRLGRTASAVATLRRAEESLLRLTSFEWTTVYQRYLARIRANLARLTITTEPEAARRRATAAARWYRLAGGYDTLATELEAMAGSR